MTTSRRTILVAGLASLLSLFRSKSLKAGTSGREISTPVLLNVFSIAGLQYYDGPEVLRRIKSGDLLRMRAEPGNPYDEFAVELFRGIDKLGYVPRSDNKALSRLLRSGEELTCRVAQVEPESFPWNAIKVEVFLTA